MIFLNANARKESAHFCHPLTQQQQQNVLSIGRSPQVSAPQGKALYATLVLGECEAAHLVPGWSPTSAQIAYPSVAKLLKSAFQKILSAESRESICESSVPSLLNDSRGQVHHFQIKESQ